MPNYAPRIFGSTITYAPTWTATDLSINKGQIVKCYDPDGVFIDVIRDAPYLSGFQENINAAAGALRVTLPRAVDSYDGEFQPGSKGTIALGNILQWWLYGAGLPETGLLKYQGVIDSISPRLDEGGAEAVEILVTPFSQILGDHAITSVVNFGTPNSSSTYIDTAVIFQAFFSGSYENSSGATVNVIDSITSKPYGDPYTLDPLSTAFTGNKAQFAFEDQALLSALSNALLMSPKDYFARMNQNKTVYFGKLPTSPTHTLLLGQHFSSLEYSVDNVPRKNVIVVKGKGSVKATATGSSVATLGQRVLFKSDNRITDTNTAQLIANGLLALHDRPQVRAKVKIPDHRGDAQPGLGYDIETFKVGDTVLIRDTAAPATSITGLGGVWGSMIWGVGTWGPPTSAPAIWGNFTWGQALWNAGVGEIFNQIVPIMSVHYNYYDVDLELGWRQPTLNRKLYELSAAFDDATLVS